MPYKLLILLVLIVKSGIAYGLEKVTLQLKWEHEFQFAGFYAANWQGYYRQAGLEVEILPAVKKDGSIVSPLDELTSGNAQFAIGSLDILTGQDSGASLAVLAPIFQRSPSAVFSLEQTPIRNLSELAKLKIAAVDNDATKIEIIALFKSRGFDISKIDFVDEPVTIETLIQGKADAIVTYDISAKVQSEEKGVKLNRLHPADFGLRFYGDTLYTRKSFLKENPELVEKFVDASILGWKFALKNKREVAFQIANELERHQIFYKDLFAYNLAFSTLIDELIDYPRTPLGHSNTDRWFTMNERLRSIGIVKSTLDKNALFESISEDSSYSSLVNLLITIVVLLPLVFIFWYKRQLPLTLLTIVTLAATTEYQLEEIIKNEREQLEKLNLTRHLASVSAKLEGNLRTNLSMINGFAAYISASPDLTRQDFDNYAGELFKKEPLLINFAAAKDLVVNFVYPLKGNEKVIGLDYKQNKAQREMVMQVANTGQLLVVGPIELIQGGKAFIGRAPIFTGSDSERRFWGIISAPLDADDLFKRSGIFGLASEANLAMRSFDSLGNQGPVFYGDKNLFEASNSVQFVISVGGGTWHLAATAKNMAEASSFTLTVSRLATVALTILIASFAIYRFKQEKEKLAYQATIRNHRRLLEKVGSVAKIGGWKVDENLNICQWSKQTAITIQKEPNYSPRKLQDLRPLFEGEGFFLLESSIKKAFNDKQPFDIELELKSQSSPIWTRVIAQFSSSSEGKYVVTGTIQDVTEKIVSAKLIEHQATYDALTDLPNRVLFNDRLNHAIEDAKREKEIVGVLFIDIDRFKPVNDNYGHSIGDKLLIEASKRILSCVRDSDTVSRLSGDEFGVILPGLKDFNNAL
ncbi:MAG: ABC transporter substrate-binding protein, partial [Kangiellaceae bacterium]|nr:ABC transporter substrate-binding protein [Kangiellaceae bacterium]